VYVIDRQASQAQGRPPKFWHYCHHNRLLSQLAVAESSVVLYCYVQGSPNNPDPFNGDARPGSPGQQLRNPRSSLGTNRVRRLMPLPQ
jgi:hypothetical protein